MEDHIQQSQRGVAENKKWRKEGVKCYDHSYPKGRDRKRERGVGRERWCPSYWWSK